MHPSLEVREAELEQLRETEMQGILEAVHNDFIGR